MYNASRVTVNSLAYYAFWGFLIHFLKLLWSQISKMTITGWGEPSISLSVILDGNEQNKPRSTNSEMSWRAESRVLTDKQTCFSCNRGNNLDSTLQSKEEKDGIYGATVACSSIFENTFY